MEIEELLPEIRKPVNETRLIKGCLQFADVLSRGAWGRHEARRVSIAQELDVVTALFSEDGEIRDTDTGGYDSRVYLEFEAQKSLTGFDSSEKTAEFESVFSISAMLREQITGDLVPRDVLKKMFKLALGRKLGKEETSDALAAIYPFYRSTSVTYSLSDEEGIDDYSIRCSYYIDETLADSTDYSRGQQFIEYVSSGYCSHGEDGAEYYEDSNRTVLTKDDISLFTQNFDEIIADVLSREMFEAMQVPESHKNLVVDEDDHCRRAMGMLQLVSISHIGMGEVRRL